MAGYRDNAFGYRFNANASEFCPKFSSNFQRNPREFPSKNIEDRTFRKESNFNNRNFGGLDNHNRNVGLRQNSPMLRQRYPAQQSRTFAGNVNYQIAGPHIQRLAMQRIPRAENYRWNFDGYSNSRPTDIGRSGLEPTASPLTYPRSASYLDHTLNFPVNPRDTFNMSDSEKVREISFLRKKLSEEKLGSITPPMAPIQAQLYRNFSRGRNAGLLPHEPYLTNQSSEGLLSHSLYRGINGFQTPEKPLVQQTLQRDTSDLTQDRRTSCSNQSLEQTIQPLRDSHEDVSEAFLDLKAVIVHFIGYDSKSKRAVKDFSLLCKDGEVPANREVLCTTSSFFFKNITPSDCLNLPYLEVHTMKLLVSLVSLGRVAILHKRLKAFMKLVGYFGIKGVFSSEDEPDASDTSVYPIANHSIEKNEFCDKAVDVQQPSRLVPKVRCLECKNVFLKSMFNLHYREYHVVLNEKERCCNKSFSTRYALISHKKTSCFMMGNRQTGLSDISEISVNLNLERPDTNTHSTPI